MTEVFDATGSELGQEGLAALVVEAMSDDLFGMTDRIIEQVRAFGTTDRRPAAHPGRDQRGSGR